VYALGGQHGENEAWGNQSQVDVYDPATDRWTRAADMPAARGHISASTVVVDGRLVVIGGTRQGNYASADVAAYDPATDAWTSLPSLPQGRKTPVADFIDGDLYVATGSFRLPTLRGRFQP
jgi:N-acetylneuraminic acid mutarotase